MKWLALIVAVIAARRLYVRWEISQRPLYPPTEST